MRLQNVFLMGVPRRTSGPCCGPLCPGPSVPTDLSSMKIRYLLDTAFVLCVFKVGCPFCVWKLLPLLALVCLLNNGVCWLAPERRLWILDGSVPDVINDQHQLNPDIRQLEIYGRKGIPRREL
jgi:hypothetical protein